MPTRWFLAEPCAFLTLQHIADDSDRSGWECWRMSSALPRRRQGVRVGPAAEVRACDAVDVVHAIRGTSAGGASGAPGHARDGDRGTHGTGRIDHMVTSDRNRGSRPGVAGLVRRRPRSDENEVVGTRWRPVLLGDMFDGDEHVHRRGHLAGQVRVQSRAEGTEALGELRLGRPRSSQTVTHSF